MEKSSAAKTAKKSKTQSTADSLLYKKENSFEHDTKQDVESAFAYAKGYMDFLDGAKTEREACVYAEKLCKDAGFSEYSFGDKLKKGGRYYYNNRGKNFFAFTIGSEPVEKGIRITAAHIDSPRLDLKQHPLFEDGGMAFLKTHYYGGIKKYQWTAIPLALHGVAVKENGETVNIVIGEKDDDPIFYINDLLPHLAHKKESDPISKAVPGEILNLVAGSRPAEDEKADEKIKLGVMRLLNEKYGITESDFISAELCAVPAQKARDVGLDRALIGSYGHDDRVCSYPALTAAIATAGGKHTVICALADKEEIGSEGVSGMKSAVLCDIIAEIADAFGANERVVRANSKCLSADVTAAYDPNFAEVYEKNNSAIVSCGVAMSKYTGGGGKSGSSDASAEMVGFVRSLLAKKNILWQTAELGKVDEGGGGTVAKFIAEHNIETVDIGVPVISMHAPYELVSKVDVYSCYKVCLAFCGE